MKDHLSLPEEIKTSLEASWIEGIPANIMLVAIDYYLIPFALFLGAAPQQIGFLVAIPHLLGSISQLTAVRVVRSAGSRLKFLITAAALQASSVLPMAFFALMAFPGRIALLILLTSLFRITGNLIATAWGSLMSDYLPPHLRGRYLGWRAQIVGLAGLVGTFMAGLLLSLAKRASAAMGFFLLFLILAACRFVSSRLFKKMTDIPYLEKPESRFTFFMFLRRFRKSNFVKFVLYVASVTFATQLAAPYISVYMLQNLKFDYLHYTCVQLSNLTAGLISFPLWGRHADHVGNAKVLKTASFLIPLIPLLWTLGRNFYYLLGVEFFSGFVWGGFNLCATNFVFDAVSAPKRVRCLGYLNLLNGVAIFLGASLGGFLAEHLPPLGTTPLLTLFLVSSILRFMAHFLLSGKFLEVRESVSHVSSHKLFFSVIGVRPIMQREEGWSGFTLLKRPFDWKTKS